MDSSTKMKDAGTREAEKNLTGWLKLRIVPSYLPLSFVFLNRYCLREVWRINKLSGPWSHLRNNPFCCLLARQELGTRNCLHAYVETETLNWHVCLTDLSLDCAASWEGIVSRMRINSVIKDNWKINSVTRIRAYPGYWSQDMMFTWTNERTNKKNEILK